MLIIFFENSFRVLDRQVLCYYLCRILIAASDLSTTGSEARGRRASEKDPEGHVDEGQQGRWQLRVQGNQGDGDHGRRRRRLRLGRRSQPWFSGEVQIDQGSWRQLKWDSTAVFLHYEYIFFALVDERWCARRCTGGMTSIGLGSPSTSTGFIRATSGTSTIRPTTITIILRRRSFRVTSSTSSTRILWINRRRPCTPLSGMGATARPAS